MSETADAVIIGAGVIGNAIAFELAKLGYSTVSVDGMLGPGASYISRGISIARSGKSPMSTMVCCCAMPSRGRATNLRLSVSKAPAC